MPSTSRDMRAARLVRELRTNQGLSAETLAYEIYKAGAGPISGRTIRRIENAGIVPTVRIQFALASYFDLLPTQIWALPTQRLVAA